ncbi:MAG: N-acetyltransferase [Deltaproteobacteria bacterium]|nr:N-acetyltransferase [Deltaproteobacteria bacterium]
MTKRLCSIGKNALVDKQVFLAYPTGREIGERRLVIGDNAQIRCGTTIYEGTTIGHYLTTGHNVVIREENLIGEHFTIWSNSVVDYGCKIGDRVKIHCNCYIAQFTTIEDEVFIAPGVSIANDIHPGCEHSTECMRGPTIKRGAQIGVNATLLPFITIGERALVGSGAVVTKDIPSCSVVTGNPAKVICAIDELKCSRGLTDHPYR